MSGGNRETRFGWLQGYTANEEEIMSLEVNKRRAEIELSRITDGSRARVDGLMQTTGTHPDKALAKIDAKLSADYQKRAQTLELIETFKDPAQTILRCKYIEGMTLDEIAKKMFFSLDHAKRIHAGARETLDFIDRYEQRCSFLRSKPTNNNQEEE